MIEFLSIALFGACLVIWSIESDRQIQEEYIESLQQKILDQCTEINRLVDLLDADTRLILSLSESKATLDQKGEQL